MKSRTIAKLLTGKEVPVGDMAVHQAFPSWHEGVRFIDPFILLHHAKTYIPQNTDFAQAGVGAHPHRGFSPVSFIFEGGVHHRDSRGNDSTIYAGGVQWMNAGNGIVHEERPPADIFANGGEQELIQMWVNTPQAHKKDDPAYFPLSKEETPRVMTDDGLIEVYIQSGELLGAHGPIPTSSPVNSATLYLKSGGKIFLPIPDGYNAFIYVLSGKLKVSDQIVDSRIAATFENDGDGISIEAVEDSRALFMSGKPLNEPVIAQGNFVMNTEGEIKQAWMDYQMGKMGEIEG